MNDDTPKDGGGDDGKIVELRPGENSGKGKRRRLSTIDYLPADVRAGLNGMIADGRASVDDLRAFIVDKGGDISRSAVGRYKVRAERTMDEYRRAQQMAEVWKKDRDKDPDGALSMLLNELVKTAAFQRLMAMTPDQAEKVDPKDLVFLSSAIKNISQSDKIGAERENLIRKRVTAELQRKQEAALTKAERNGDMDKVAAQKARRILGFAD